MIIFWLVYLYICIYKTNCEIQEGNYTNVCINDYKLIWMYFLFFRKEGYIYRYPVQYIAIHAGMMMMMDAKFYFF